VKRRFLSVLIPVGMASLIFHLFSDTGAANVGGQLSARLPRAFTPCTAPQPSRTYLYGRRQPHCIGSIKLQAMLSGSGAYRSEMIGKLATDLTT
jgi:hypothetical protein